MRFRATPAKPKPPTRTSSPSGKTPTPIFPSSSLRRPNTQNYGRSLLKFCDQVLPAPGKWGTRKSDRHGPETAFEEMRAQATFDGPSPHTTRLRSSLKALRPMLGAVVDREDHDIGLLDGIRNDERRYRGPRGLPRYRSSRWHTQR